MEYVFAFLGDLSIGDPTNSGSVPAVDPLNFFIPVPISLVGQDDSGLPQGSSGSDQDDTEEDPNAAGSAPNSVSGNTEDPDGSSGDFLSWGLVWMYVLCFYPLLCLYVVDLPVN